jgi:hypothetical protein
VNELIVPILGDKTYLECKFLQFQFVVALYKCNCINLKHNFLWPKFTSFGILCHGKWDVFTDILEEHNHRS